MKQKKTIKTSSHEYIKDTAATGYLESFIKAHSSVSACALSTILYLCFLYVLNESHGTANVLRHRSLAMSIFQNMVLVKKVSTHHQNQEQRDDDQTEAQKIQTN